MGIGDTLIRSVGLFPWPSSRERSYIYKLVCTSEIFGRLSDMILARSVLTALLPTSARSTCVQKLSDLDAITQLQKGIEKRGLQMDEAYSHKFAH